MWAGHESVLRYKSFEFCISTITVNMNTLQRHSLQIKPLFEIFEKKIVLILISTVNEF